MPPPLDKGKAKELEVLGHRGVLLFCSTLPAIDLILLAIDLNHFCSKSALRPAASSSTFRGCFMDGNQPKDDPMPIDDIVPPPQGGSSFPLPAELDISGGHSMCDGQVNGEPMLIDHAFSIFDGGSSFPLRTSASTRDIPRLDHQVEAVPMFVDDADPNSNGT